MARPSKGMMIALIVGVLAILAAAGGWWYYNDAKERKERAAAAAAAFDRAKAAGERADRNVKDNIEKANRLTKGR